MASYDLNTESDQTVEVNSLRIEFDQPPLRSPVSKIASTITEFISIPDSQPLNPQNFVNFSPDILRTKTLETADTLAKDNKRPPRLLPTQKPSCKR